MTSVARVCSVEGCGAAHYGRGLCARHYQRMRKGVPLTAPFESRDGTQGCNVPNCDRKHSSKGYCRFHYTRWATGRDITAPSTYGFKGCSVLGCTREHYMRLMCRRHSDQAKRYGLTVERLVAIQDMPCEICGSELSKPFIDHDHSCCPGDTSCGDCVRGVLCQGCNLGLGAFRDDPARMTSAIQYLSRNGID